jgi:RNA polymerase sigma factor (sigma-70 family)
VGGQNTMIIAKNLRKDNMDENTRNKWLIDNMAFVHHICRKYNCMHNYEDILQTAYYATLVALSRVKDGADEKQIRAYVSLYIDGYIQKYCLNNVCLVYIPEHLRQELKGKIKVDSINYEFKGDEKDKTYEEIHLQYDEKQYEEVETKLCFNNFLSEQKPKKRNVFSMMAEGIGRPATAKALKLSQERIRQILKEERLKYKNCME